MTTILIIDDDEAMQRSLEELLQMHGYATHTLSNGTRAVDVCTSRKIDCVILDIFMPDTDGIATVSALRKRCPEIPKIAISGGMLYEERLNFLELTKKLGVRHTFSKPLDFKKVLAAIEDVVENNGNSSGPSSDGSTPQAG